ncbi:hypothetical protein AAE478_001377 [Parahypoxylon ruwenzoriense]
MAMIDALNQLHGLGMCKRAKGMGARTCAQSRCDPICDPVAVEVAAASDQPLAISMVADRTGRNEYLHGSCEKTAVWGNLIAVWFSLG